MSLDYGQALGRTNPHLKAILEAIEEVMSALNEGSSGPTPRYEFVRILGSGAMGFVFLVRHEIVGLQAVKGISKEALARVRNPEALKQRFLKEARAMGRLKNQHIVQVMTANAAGTPYIVMEYLEGGTVHGHFNTFGAMPPRQAVEVTLCILSALQAAHEFVDEKGKPTPIVHRDIKPENVMLTKDGVPKIADFGIAHIEEGTHQLTGDASTLGSLPYMAPEQRDARTVDGRADLYATAVTLYSMLVCPTSIWISEFHLASGRNPEMLENVHPSLLPIIQKATAEKREDRYASAAEMAQALRAVWDELPENPDDTAPLGSAPAARAAQKSQEPQEVVAHTAAAPSDPGEEKPHRAEGGTLFPGRSKGASVIGAVALEEVQELPKEPRISQTEIGHQAELVQVRQESQRRSMIALFIFLAVIAGGWGVFSWLRKSESVPVVTVPIAPQAPQAPITSVTSAASRPTEQSNNVRSFGRVDASVAPATSTPASVAKAPAEKPKPEKKKKQPNILPAPTTVAAKTSASEPAVQTATVSVTFKAGEAAGSIHLRGDGGVFTLSSADPTASVVPGTYKISADFDGMKPGISVGSVTISAGATTLLCTARFESCDPIP